MRLITIVQLGTTNVQRQVVVLEDGLAAVVRAFLQLLFCRVPS